MPDGLRIGLTGGIASGKSTVAQRFCELGVPVIDADESARVVVSPGEPGLARVVEQFGTGILTDDGHLDRPMLRRLVFGNPSRRVDLEEILHPLIREDMERRASASIGPYIVLAVPLLVERRTRDRINRILVVDLPEDLQLRRVVERDGGTLEDARAIVAAQADRQSRLGAADDVLVNTGSIADLHRAIDLLHERYLRLAATGA